MTTTKNATIVAFHIGRGGRFHNQGHLSYIGERRIGDFTSDLFLNYENEGDFKNRFGYDSTGDSDQQCITDLIYSEKFDELKEKFGITKEMLGEQQWYDGGGNPVGLTAAEEKTGLGRIDIDRDYDTTYCCLLSEIGEEEARAILAETGWVSNEIVDYANEILGQNETEDNG